jgi:Rps23 Pro-64 3,4-dihydroxylase Tpa1-like proline 4-hydroxylase
MAGKAASGMGSGRPHIVDRAQRREEISTMRLNPNLDTGALSRTLAAEGRVQIRDFLHAGEAARLHDFLRQETAWVRSLNRYADENDRDGSGGDVAVSVFEALPQEKKDKFYAYIRQTARENKLQYCYDKIKISEIVQGGSAIPDYLQNVYDFVFGPVFGAFIEQLTGATDPRMTDTRAYRYLPGHFIMPHSDTPGEYERVYAWVLNLNPVWRVPWGGLLEFINDEGLIVETFVPLFNSINVFRIPQLHAVSYVTPFAAEPRYSCTGWISFNRRIAAT